MLVRASAYIALIEKYLNRDISVHEFESEFLSRFKSEPIGMPEHLYQVLDQLFGEVDMFCDDDQLRSDEEIDETELREACTKTLSALLSM